MKKILSALVLAAMAACLAGCGGDALPEGGSNSPNPSAGEYELIRDAKFEDGIAVSALNSHAVSYTWWQYQNQNEPIWSLGQYCDLSATRTGYDATKNDLTLGDELFGIEGYGITGKDGSKYTLTNQSGSKYMAVDPAKGAVTLNIDTSKEYIDPATNEIKKRSDGEDWVHMILEQSSVVQLSDCESLTMSLDFTLDESELIDGTVGASQFQWIFSVHDKAHSTSSVKEYFWFNVTLYDNRYEVFPGTDMFDGGKQDATGKYIYAPRGDELFENGGKVEVGVKYHVSLDLKEYMHAAFEKAQSRGALPNSSWEDMSINGFNLGWEVSNVSKVGVTIENLSLTVKEKNG